MRPKKNPVTKLIGAGVKAAAKAAGKNVKPSLKAAKRLSRWLILSLVFA